MTGSRRARRRRRARPGLCFCFYCRGAWGHDARPFKSDGPPRVTRERRALRDAIRE